MNQEKYIGNFVQRIFVCDGLPVRLEIASWISASVSIVNKKIDCLPERPQSDNRVTPSTGW